MKWTGCGGEQDAIAFSLVAKPRIPNQRGTHASASLTLELDVYGYIRSSQRISHPHSDILKLQNQSRTQLYLPLPMISQQGLPPDQRYLETVVHNIKRREDSIEAERNERQDDIERLARCALSVKKTLTSFHQRLGLLNSRRESAGAGGGPFRSWIQELDAGGESISSSTFLSFLFYHLQAFNRDDICRAVGEYIEFSRHRTASSCPSRPSMSDPLTYSQI